MRGLRASMLCAALFTMPCGSALAQSDSAGELAKPIEDCIRHNAPAVEQVFSSLNDGVTFLVADLCGAPIAAEQERKRHEASLAAQEQAHEKCEENRRATAQSNPNSATQPDTCSSLNMNVLGGLLNPFMGPMQETMAAQVRYYNSKPPIPTSLAAKLLLELRLQRVNATHSQASH